MTWLRIWWHQLRGHSAPDPWEYDPAIRAARTEQHQRINHAHRLLVADGKAMRQERQFWQKYGGGSPPPKRTPDDG